MPQVHAPLLGANLGVGSVVEPSPQGCTILSRHPSA